MTNTHLIHIDKAVFRRSVFLFEFSTTVTHNLKELNKVIQGFIEAYSPIIPLGTNLILLYGLKNEKRFLDELAVRKPDLYIDTYSLICIDKGYIASSWLKKI